ncbi:sugar ABC transporter substrate-binding protein [Rhizobium leguminosarum bv. trifolii CB782]|uniref:galactofuranose ABC transporter, galactofuranose-binding protein YtfQ n=1 Tax=Rhizobium hidalgonense TaxID=1538159 RepID=UPI00027D3410|nr:galactofuranose ABC transporter, galactofuranose-binding protein YtfQ [Rhizobium hidalgonense]AHG45356.1 sugar ABC transporter substrate-binding protein [Rhizobium leguminosarum bv. trifolii CB782]EJC72692.1 ABC-type sugar transport system, periplasmic component [Rhizobium leguminosarum bv. trifolii WSM2012]MDR9805415.1 galactofuranose ABC transporter, galactofuranose-binding protein YtfQ [Rhizobium hidalgonense]QKK23824.1 ABC transporter substrate-binding protein [Rhizobium hidalgonense]RW
MKLKTALLSATILAACMFGSASAGGLTVGFSQIGSESGWRAAETTVTKEQAKKRGIDLKFADAQQKQENQIKALRSFIAQGVDAILIAPVVETGWDDVLKEAKEAKIPVILLDRTIKAPDDLYLTAVTSDLTHEGKVAGDFLVKTVGDKKCNVVELQGTTGSSPAIARKKGFEEALAGHDNLKIVRSQTGDFTRTKGKEVMESFLKAENGGKDICALYAHNDDMAVGAIQAIKEAGLKPGKDILVVSIDAVPDIFKAMSEGESNATVELTPNMAGPAFDALDAYLKDKKAPAKWIQTESKLYTPADEPMKVYEEKKGQGY